MTSPIMTTPFPKEPLVRLPKNIEIILYLIREELKNQKFFNTFNKLGFGDVYYQTALGELVLTYVGLNDGKAETFNFYYKIIEGRSKKIQEGSDALTTQALKVYMELMLEKKRRKELNTEKPKL
jgi:hypothetical protein